MTNTQSSSRSRPDHEAISARARQLWRERGEPTGLDDEIWFEAERSLQREADAAKRADAPANDLTLPPIPIVSAKPAKATKAPTAAAPATAAAKTPPPRKSRGRAAG